MEVIAVANQKGGSGKTTTAINLAAYLSLKGKHTLLIDLDPQGAATTGLGIDKRTLKKTVYNTLIGDLNLAEIIITTKVDGFDLAPTNIDLSGAELELVSQLGRETLLKQKIEKLNGYDFVIIDTPPSLGLLTLNSLMACSTLLIPIQTEYYALEGMSQLLKVVDMVGERLGNKMKRRYLLTMYDSRTKLSKEVAQQVREHFKEYVFQAVIPRNVKLAEAPSYGMPIHLYDPDSAGATAYEQLANEVIGNE
jgi:chromosome partitioning protein